MVLVLLAPGRMCEIIKVTTFFFFWAKSYRLLLLYLGTVVYRGLFGSPSQSSYKCTTQNDLPKAISSFTPSTKYPAWKVEVITICPHHRVPRKSKNRHLLTRYDLIQLTGVKKLIWFHHLRSQIHDMPFLLEMFHCSVNC